MSEEQFEIRIICDKRSHPAHKGRDWHVTALALYVLDDGNLVWLQSEREMSQRPDSLDYSVIPGYRLVGGPDRRPPVHFIESSGREHESQRFEMTCRRCPSKVVAQGETVFKFLDKLQAAGIRQVSLQAMSDYLDADLTE